MYASPGYSEYKKLIRIYDAISLDRPGYWACIECSAHNPNTIGYCQVCNTVCWRVKMELLSMGPLTTMVQNVAYALPVSRCLLFCQTVAATFVISNDPAMATTAPLALSAAGMAEVSGGFIKCTSGNVIVTFKKA